MARLSLTRPAPAGPPLFARSGDLWWVLGVGGAGALVLGWLVNFSIQATCAFALVVLVVALHQYDRRWGVAALFALWLFVPFVRRLLAMLTGTPANDPLSLAPFLSTAAIAALELVRVHVPNRVRVIMLVAGGGFAIGLPVGFLVGPRSAVYAIGAYLACVAAAAIGYAEGRLASESTMRRALLFAVPIIAAYAIAQRYLPLTPWDQHWLDTTDFDSIGTGNGEKVRVFGTLNAPGTLAPILALSLLCYLTVVRHRTTALLGATLVLVALSLTYVRSAWIALIAAGIAHMLVSRGRSARLIMGAGAVTVAASLALSPVSSAARDVVDRFQSIGSPNQDKSATERQTSFFTLFPTAASAPLGHGLGTAGEPSKLTGETDLRFTDNGYLSLIYQVGPVGFALVLAALGAVLMAGWQGGRDESPGQEMRWLLFAMFVYLLVLLPSGDAFYGVSGVVLWLVAGQMLGYDVRRRARPPDGIAVAANAGG
jgi:putative inorganic carbon (hco3(-)) transporter